ncbi:MAG TPA: acetate kinase [Bacteroidota bacterium]|nr:acetate kinase [Bacteroidota bacterium]
MNILVLNCGSSSVKYELIEVEARRTLARGIVERIGMSGATLSNIRYDGDEIKIAGEIVDHIVAIEYILAVLLSRNHGVIADKSDIHAIGHRVVHGGETFTSSVLITDEVIKGIRSNFEIAPLHNPHNLRGINACQINLPGTPQVAVFDTAFHQKMPKKAYLYGLPYSLYSQYRIRRYGFHGMSHRYVSERAAVILKRDPAGLKLVTCHLGSGCSMAAVDGGISVDTTMGFTPLEGLLMGTRSGDIDPSVILYIMGKEGIALAEANTLLNKHSGLQGISGVSSDMREIISEMKNGDKKSTYAFDVFCYRVRKYIGAYAAAMGGLDGVVFTGGIGENSPDVRKRSCEGLDFLGIMIDDERNGSSEKEKVITTASSKVSVLVVPTNEELVIAMDTNEIVKGLKLPERYTAEARRASS